MPSGDLPDWLPAWCLEHLGADPADVLFQVRQVSMVFGLRLAGGRDVVVKARADNGRAVSCVAAQAQLAERGFPCARPLTPVAERLLDQATSRGDSDPRAQWCLELAKLHMALAHVAATAQASDNREWVMVAGPWFGEMSLALHDQGQT